MNISRQRYEELIEAEDKLNKLINGGVDNWKGCAWCFECDEDDIYGNDDEEEMLDEPGGGGK